MPCELINNPFIESPDSALIAASKGGEARAFGVLVERYNAKVFSVVLRITRNREDAEDILQQCFQRALVHLQSFQGRASFCTWLTRIAINEALMWRRKKRAINEVVLESMNWESGTISPLEIPDASANPEETFAREERARILCSAMNRLPPRLRTALRCQLEERTIRETARTLGMRIPTIKAKLFRARERLRQLLVPLRRSSEEICGQRFLKERRDSATIPATPQVAAIPLFCNPLSEKRTLPRDLPEVEMPRWQKFFAKQPQA